MKNVFAILVLAVLLALGSSAADAQTRSRVIYQAGNWQVKVVYFPSGTECQARVGSGDGSFSIWAVPGRGLKLHFFSSSWSFGERHTQTVRMQIDSHNPWRTRNARLSSKSIFIDLPNTDAGSRFLGQVRHGSRLKLYNANGNYVRGYSLTGSNASIQALASCVRSLRTGGSTNPFD